MTASTRTSALFLTLLRRGVWKFRSAPCGAIHHCNIWVPSCRALNDQHLPCVVHPPPHPTPKGQLGMQCSVLFRQEFVFVVLNLHTAICQAAKKRSTLLAREKAVGFVMVLSFCEIVPRSQPSFPEGAATHWLVESCKLQRLSQGAGDYIALESHLFHVWKLFKSSFEHMPTYHNILKEPLALAY